MSKRAKVLIVDDDPINRLVLEKTLKGEHDVFLVESGEKALTFVKTAQVDLIILDVIMPGIDGYQVLVELKENPITQSIPIIFIFHQIFSLLQNFSMKLVTSIIISLFFLQCILKAYTMTVLNFPWIINTRVGTITNS